MNDGFKIAALVMAALMLLCCGGVVMTLSPVSATVEKREQQARTFGDRFTRQILTGYDAKQLVVLSTPRYRDQFSIDDFQRTLEGNKAALGDFIDGNSKAHLVKAEKINGAQTIVAQYTNRARFEKGRAQVNMELVYTDKKWAVNLFAIEPD